MFRDRALRAVAAGQMGLITRAQVVELGLPRRSLERLLADGRWVVVLPRVYLITGLPPTPEQLALAACLWARPAALSHRAAARRYGLYGIEEDLIEITTSLEMRHPLITVHRDLRFADEPLRHISGIPVTAPERTLMDLAAVVSPRRLERALDDVLARRLTTVPRLEDKLVERARSGRNGTVVFRRFVLERRDRSGHPESGDETDFLRMLRDAGFELPIPQHRVDLKGRPTGRIDLAYPQYGIEIELDTMRWHSSRQDLQDDSRRQNELVASGKLVLRFTREDRTERSAETLARIAEAIESRRGWDPAAGRKAG